MQTRTQTENIVIGANGLVGSHVLIQLLLQNRMVTATSRTGKASPLIIDLLNWYNVPLEKYSELVQWKTLDITDIFSIEEIISSNSVVYHCAGLVSFSESHKDELERINVDGTANLVNVCTSLNILKFVYVSSVSTLSVKENTNVLNEESFWKTSGRESNYARSKYKAEMEVWRGVEEGLNVVIVNPTIIIGPHNFSQGSVQLIEAVANGLKFFPSGATGFVDADDLANVLIKLADSDITEERFVINNVNLSYRDFLSKVAVALQVNSPRIRVTNWMASLAWRIDKVRTSLFNKKPLVTKETAYASAQSVEYDTRKLSKYIHHAFTPIEGMITNTCSFYLKQNTK